MEITPVEIVIRVSRKEDMGRIVEIFDHPDVVPESSQHPYLGNEKISFLFETTADKSIVLVAEFDGQIDGYIQICLNHKPRSKHVANLGLAVHPKAQGKGIGSALIEAVIDQADNWLNIIRLELDVYTDNERAISLYKKYGFEIEGESKFAAFKNGEYTSLFKMARIRK
jgi:putative acetyltransferase